jgi:glutathione S-transferase
VARAFQPETHAKAVEAFEAVEARLASEPYLGGSTPSFED